MGAGLHAVLFKVSQWLWIVSRFRPRELRVALIPNLLS